MDTRSGNYAAPLLVVGCVVFGLGSLIVKFVDVGPYAIAFWRLLIAAPIFFLLGRFFRQKMPTKRKTVGYAILSGVFLAFDLALWHESIHAVGPGISTLLNSLQIFFLAAIGFFFYSERLSTLQILSLILATIGVALIGSPEFGHNDNAAWGFPLMMILSFGGAMALVIPSLLFDTAHLYPKTLNDVILVSIYGIVMQCFAWALIAYAIPLLSLSLTGLLLLSEPVAAMLIDYFWLDKPINTVQWIGATLTLLAIYLGSLKDKK